METQATMAPPVAPVIMAGFDFFLTDNIRTAREELGYSQEELAFLFGRERNFVSTIEDPRNKKKYDISHLNFYGKVLNKLPRKLIPKSSIPGGLVRIKAICVEEAGMLKYEAEGAWVDGPPISSISFKVAKSPTHSEKEQTAINAHVKELFGSGYFDEPKTAFETFQYCRNVLKKKFQPGVLMEVLAGYTRRKKVPRLVVEKNEEGWNLFTKQWH